MGIQTYVLDRRRIPLTIGGRRHFVGSLRRYYKVTELDAERVDELESAAVTPSPAVAMVVDIAHLTLSDRPGIPMAACLVIAWDQGRGHTQDFDWDGQPQLGYAVFHRSINEHILYEYVGGALTLIDVERARELGILDADGQLMVRT